MPLLNLDQIARGRPTALTAQRSTTRQLTVSRTYARTEGFGSQYQAQLSGYAYCAATGACEYVHTPFRAMDHGVDFASLERFVNLGKLGANPRGRAEVKDIVDEVHWAQRPSRYYTPRVLARIRDAYWSTDKPTVPVYDFVVHIRRGDNTATHMDGRKYTPNSRYSRVLDRIFAENPRAQVCVVSEGKKSDFEGLDRRGVHFLLGGDLKIAFHTMVRARALVVAFSSLSYCAALLNPNRVVVIIDYWHKPLDHWERW